MLASSILFKFKSDEYIKQLLSMKEVIEKVPELASCPEIPCCLKM